MFITRHATKRSKERVGLNKNASERIAEKALKEGIKHSEVSGSLSRFLDGIYLGTKKPNNMRIYNQKIYLFRDDILLTILNLPKKYHNTVEKIKKQKENNINEY